MHDPQQGDGCCPGSGVGHSQSSLHVVDETFHIDPGGTKTNVNRLSYTALASLVLLSLGVKMTTENYPAKPNSFMAFASQLRVSAWFFGFFCPNAIETT